MKYIREIHDDMGAQYWKAVLVMDNVLTKDASGNTTHREKCLIYTLYNYDAKLSKSDLTGRIRSQNELVILIGTSKQEVLEREGDMNAFYIKFVNSDLWKVYERLERIKLEIQHQEECVRIRNYKIDNTLDTE